MPKKEDKKISKDKTSFMKSFRAELKKVVWPTPKQLFNNTVAVLTIVVVTALIVFVLDITFEAINKQGLDRIKSSIVNSKNEVSEESNSIDEETSTENEVINEATENIAE